jgi:hypothetical protein
LRETCSAAAETRFAWVADSSAEPVICEDTAESSSEEDASPCALLPIALIVSRSRTIAAFNARAICPTSSLLSRSRCMSR